jgi:hypothetical protein
MPFFFLILFEGNRAILQRCGRRLQYVKKVLEGGTGQLSGIMGRGYDTRLKLRLTVLFFSLLRAIM